MRDAPGDEFVQVPRWWLDSLELPLDDDGRDTLAYELEIARRAFEAGNRGAALHAFTVCREFDYAPPGWLVDLATRRIGLELIGERSGGRDGRHARWIREYHEDQADRVRAELVDELRTTWHVAPAAVYAAAVELLRGGLGEALPSKRRSTRTPKPSEDTIKNACRRYATRRREQPWRYLVIRGVSLRSVAPPAAVALLWAGTDDDVQQLEATLAPFKLGCG